MTYTPRPGSIAERAHQALQIHGELSTAALEDAADIERGLLQPSINIALREGYIAKTKREGLNYYRVGDGIPPPLPAAAGADDVGDDAPIVQRTVPAAKAAPVKVNGNARSAFDAAASVKGEARVADSAPAAGKKPAFRLALWSDGCLQIERADTGSVLLDADEVRELVAYLDRLATA